MKPVKIVIKKKKASPDPASDDAERAIKCVESADDVQSESDISEVSEASSSETQCLIPPRRKRGRPRKDGQELSAYAQRYQSDTEFRERCLGRLREKLPCEVCGKMVSRGNRSRHVATKHHLETLKKCTPDHLLKQKVQQLEEQLKAIKTLIT